MNRVLIWIVGMAIALFIVGATVVPLTIPMLTRSVAARTSLAEDAGLSRARMLQIAEQVRTFVVDDELPTLPATVDGRAGFDEAAVSHLLDVRRVLSAARVTTGLLAALLAVGLAFEVAFKRMDRVADTLKAGALCCVGFVVLAVFAAMVNFEAFFSAFHGLFFESGTWTFAGDSLLIQTFPEAFWTSMGLVWATLVLSCAGVLGLAAKALRPANKPAVTMEAGQD